MARPHGGSGGCGGGHIRRRRAGRGRLCSALLHHALPAARLRRRAHYFGGAHKLPLPLFRGSGGGLCAGGDNFKRAGHNRVRRFRLRLRPHHGGNGALDGHAPRLGGGHHPHLIVCGKAQGL